MRPLRPRARFLLTPVALLLLVLGHAGCVSLESPGYGEAPVYLTWQGDTSTTMTVSTLTPGTDAVLWLHYGEEEAHGELGRYAHRVPATTQVVELPERTREVHSAELQGLDPGRKYFFQFSDGDTPMGAEAAFRTLLPDTRDLRFIVGGDMGTFQRTRRLLRHAAKTDPMFAIIGGDIAYANADPGDVDRWDRWFRNWHRTMRTSDGCLVPIIAAIGNHEVRTGPSGEPEAPFYLSFLPQGGGTYFSRRLGNAAVVHVLDSGHVTPVEGAQTAWLAQALENTPASLHQFAVYHVPMYPCHRAFDDRRSVVERENWLPLFDAYGLALGFEHHDHALKRTHPLRGGEVTPGGTVYLGDGCFGMPPRRIEQQDLGYLAHAGRSPHFWRVEVSGPRIVCAAIGLDGRTLDRYTREE